MKVNWPKANQLTNQSEGGFVNRKTDKGGPTNMGITLTRLSQERGYQCTIQDLKNLTREEANKIYKSGYWDTVKADDLPSGLDYAVYDFYVNSGSWAIRILQRTLGVNEDGVIGSVTMKAIEDYPGGVRALIKDYIDGRMKFLRSLGGKQGFGPNGRGWTIRVTGTDPKHLLAQQPGVLGNALEMAKTESSNPKAAAKKVEVTPTVVPEAIQQATAPKATNDNRSITSISMEPDALASYATTATGLITAVSGNSVLTWCLGGVILVGGLYGIYTIIKAKRAQV